MPKRMIEFEDLKNEHFPIITFSAHSWNIVSYIIRLRTRSANNHVMWMIDSENFVSQDFAGYRQVSYLAYNKPGNRLKFVRVKNMTDKAAVGILLSIGRKLKSSWFRKSYDVIGLIGKAIGIRRLHSPWQEFCVEDVIKHLRRARNLSQGFATFLDTFSNQLSPQEFNEIIKNHPHFFEVIGYWQYD